MKSKIRCTILIVLCTIVYNLYTMNSGESITDNSTVKIKDAETTLTQQMLQSGATKKTTGLLSYQDPIWYNTRSVAYILTKPLVMNGVTYHALQLKGTMGIAKDGIVRFKGESSYMPWAGTYIKSPDTYFTIHIDPTNSNKNKMIEAPARPLLTNEEIKTIQEYIKHPQG